MASPKKEPVYGPVKAFSYLTSSDQQDAPSGALRRDESMRRDNNPYQSKAENLNRQSLFPPEGDDFLNDHDNRGFTNGGYHEDKHGTSSSNERHPTSPDHIPSLFDNFILKGPGSGPATGPEPVEVDKRNSYEESGRGRQALQDLFQEPPPAKPKPDDRSTKYSSQASSTMALLNDRNSRNSNELKPLYPSPAKYSASTTHLPSEPYNPRPRHDSTREVLNINSPSVVAPKKNGEFFPQLGTAPMPAQAAPKLRPVTNEGDLNTFMRNGGQSSSTNSTCILVVVAVVVGLICLGVGFVIGWFTFKMVNADDTTVLSTTTITPSSSTLLPVIPSQTSSSPDLDLTTT